MVYSVLKSIVACLLACAAITWALTGPLSSREKSDSTEKAEGVEYKLGVEDVLSVFVWKESDLSKTVTVRPDGRISFPLIGDIIAEGLTCTQLAEEIKKKLLLFIKDPLVTVTADQINSFKVYVLGEVNRQGVYTLKGSAKLLQVLAMAEGLNQYANRNELTIIRQESDREIRIKVDYKKIMSGERPDNNLYIKPGDTIVVQ